MPKAATTTNPSPEHPVQELATGKSQPMSPFFRNLPGAKRSGFDPPPAGALRMYIVGEVGKGKTTFLCSVPRSLVLDFGRKTDHIDFDVAGRVILPVWSYPMEKIEEIHSILYQEGVDNRRSFDMIVYDDVAAYQRMVIDHLSKTVADGKSIKEYGKKGKGWDLVNDWLIGRWQLVMQAGYGWMVSGHLQPRILGEGADATQVWEHVVSPGVRKYLLGQCHYTGECVRENEPYNVTVVKKIGKDSRNVVEQRWRSHYFLDMETARDPDSQRIEARQHITLDNPKIEIPQGKGWEAFATEYDRAVKRRREEVLRRSAT